MRRPELNLKNVLDYVERKNALNTNGNKLDHPFQKQKSEILDKISWLINHLAIFPFLLIRSFIPRYLEIDATRIT